MATERPGETQVEYLRGPHGWLNWRAQRSGYPRRDKSHLESMVIRPIWEEFALYSDMLLQGAWVSLGPFELLPLDHQVDARIGEVKKMVMLRP